MSFSDGTRPTRKFGGKSPKKLCVTKNENGDKTTTTISHCTGHRHSHYHHSHHRFLDGPQPSVHKRNLYIVSFPLILLFNVLRTLLYQLFIVFKYLYTSTSQLIQRRQASKQACQLEVVIGQRPTDGRLINGNRIDENMSQVPRRSMGPGPGDPLLAKQKHHHRRAFEFISKALKIDEDNEGQKEMAIDLYKKGIGELEKGIAVECTGGHGEVWEHAQRLHDKMCTNLAMAKDRLDFLVSMRELKKLGINNNINNRAPGNKTDSEHPGKHLRTRRNAHTFQTARTSSNINYNKNTNNIHTTVNAGQTMCTQIPKLRPRSPKNCFAHTAEGIVRLRFWA